MQNLHRFFFYLGAVEHRTQVEETWHNLQRLAAKDY